MQNVYTVKQVNAYIKNMFTQDFMLSRIYVKGEVSNCKYHSSGHIYFSLKDASGTIACIMFAGSRGGLAFQMKDGQQVIVFGGITTYERDGKYQLYAKEIRLDGLGVLYERFQALKEELNEMGMFDEGYKQPIPRFAKRIGIVTAPTGAAIRDIMNISRRRNPYVQLILYPALVQGDGAKESIVRGIKALEKEGVDVMIVGRGGGSMEDLWAFNEEEVARAVFESRVPVISAVGHETDTTIADYVADLRAPTPSAAAELAVWEYGSTALRLTEYEAAYRRFMAEQIRKERMRLNQCALRLKLSHPENTLNAQKQHLAEASDTLQRMMRERLTSCRHRLALAMEGMKGLSPIEKLNQGYAYIENSRREAVKQTGQVKPNDLLTIYVSDGTILAEVKEKKEVRHGE